MKRTLLALSLTVVFLIAGSTAPAIAQTAELPYDLKILNFESNSFEPTASAFEGNFTAAGNEYVNETTYDFANLETDGYDVLLLPRTEGLTATDLSNIQTWFATGEKVLWIGGESDFSDFYDADDSANPLLAELGSALRVSTISVEDPVSNDDAAYRVAPNSAGVSSDFTDFVTDGFERMIMHGPTAIHYEMDGTAYDLRNATLGEGALANVDIIVNASSNAIALDSSISLGESDFYAFSDVDGDYPMLVTDQIDDSLVVTSGEAVFTDYKEMYNSFDENGGDAHQGKLVVDRVFEYFYYEIVGLERLTDDADDGGIPFNSLFVAFGISTIAIFTAIRRKNN